MQTPIPQGLEPPRPRSKNTAAIVLAIVGGCLVFALVAIAVLAALLFPAFAQAREAARKVQCMSNAKQLGTAIAMYTMDNDNRLPPASTWMTGIGQYVGPGVGSSCPSRPGAIGPFAYNSKHDRLPMTKFDSSAAAPQLFESGAGQLGASDPLTSFTMPHLKSGLIGYADGHVKAETSAPSAAAGLR